MTTISLKLVVLLVAVAGCLNSIDATPDEVVAASGTLALRAGRTLLRAVPTRSHSRHKVLP